VRLAVSPGHLRPSRGVSVCDHRRLPETSQVGSGGFLHYPNLPEPMGSATAHGWFAPTEPATLGWHEGHRRRAGQKLTVASRFGPFTLWARTTCPPVGQASMRLQLVIDPTPWGHPVGAPRAEGDLSPRRCPGCLHSIKE
jgi:hypothetical protein